MMRWMLTFWGILLTAGGALGETRVEITGTTRKSGGQILELMGGRLEHVRKSVASASRADDAAFLVRQVMRKDGYSEVRVAWKVVNREKILLTVTEGARLSLGTVMVNGVEAEEARTLAKLFARPAEKDRPFGFDDPPFREADVETGLGFLKQELNANGYWAAEVVLISKAVDAATGKVDVMLEVRRGARHRISEARVTGPDRQAAAVVKRVAKPYVGEKATTKNLNAMRVAVEEAIDREGYPDAKISMQHGLGNGLFIPEFFVDLGKRVRLNRVWTEGLVRTDPGRILERMENLQDGWYDEAEVNARVRGFLATGAFSSVRVERREVAAGRVDATLHFEEAKAREVTAAFGAGSYQGLIVRTAYADRNLFGELLGFSSGFEFSSRGILGETRLTDPWLFGTDVAGTARVYALIYGREGYSSFQTGAEAKVTWKFGKHYSLELLAGNSLVNLSGEGLPSEELGETVFTHPLLRVTQSLDFRDSAILPKDGWHFEVPLELGAAVGDLTTSYVKAGISGGWYRQVNDRLELGLGGEWKMLVPGGDGRDLPIDLRLFNGGARTVRSFAERELGPSVEGYATGGEGMWSVNAEVLRRLSGSLKVVGFVDAGTLAREYDSLGGSEVELAAGLGLRLDLPIGPVRLEYGYNLTRDEGEPQGTLHFAIGTAF